MFSIPRQRRLLSEVKVEYRANPASYNVTDVYNYKKPNAIPKGVKIGRE